jgi:hypothetical protein
MIGFALGPVLILFLVSRYGTGATPWLMIPGLLLGILVFVLLPRARFRCGSWASRAMRPTPL